MKTLNGTVIKAVSSTFFVDTEKGVKRCFARKKLKLDGDIYVGDKVVVSPDYDNFVIEEVLSRRNCLVRPYVSNIDVCLIVLANEPEPDLLLADKIIVNCLVENIEPILVNNKTDLEKVELLEYKSVCKSVFCSAETGEGIGDLFSLIKGKTACLAGQSGVGKSSIINALLDSSLCEVGEMAKKIRRGKNTTRKTEIFNLGGTYMVDTCGFNMLESVDIEPENLRLYYDDFEIYRKECRFNGCTHTFEPDCEVKPRVGKEIGAGRYARYKTIYQELEDRRKNKYE